MALQLASRSTVHSRQLLARPAAPAVAPRSAVRHVLSQPSSGSASAQHPPKSFFDMAFDTVLSLIAGEPKQDAASEELQMPPELLAYLKEMEAQESGSHGGWVHSHIADRLAGGGDGGADDH